MSIIIQLPGELERDLRDRFGDLDAQAKEAFAVELYRQGKLTHSQLSRILELSRFETDGILKRHGVYSQMTLDDVLRDAETSRQAREQ